MIAKISDSATDISNDAEILQLPGRQVLEIRVVRELSQRSDAWGLSRAHIEIRQQLAHDAPS